MTKSTILPSSALMLLVGVTLIAAGSADCLAGTVTFRVLKGSGPTAQSSVANISDDGLTAVGAFQEFNESLVAARWSLPGATPTDLTGAQDVFLDTAFGVSGDGAVIVGTTQFLGPHRLEPYRWTEANGREVLPLLAPGTSASADAITGDGEIIAGTAQDANGVYRAVYWDSTSNIIQLPDDPDRISYAEAVSEIGDVIVGQAADEAALWDAARQLTLLGKLPGKQGSQAFDVSSDGAIVVGNSEVQPFYWTAATGMLDLGLPAGATALYAFGVSADGGIIVGGATFPGGPAEAVIMGPGRHWRSVEELLASLGHPTQWQLTYARAVTPDGRIIVGDGIAPDGRQLAWAITIPEPSSWLLLAMATGLAGVVARLRRCSSSTYSRLGADDATMSGT